jgi:predicted lipoprotein with Yx(FWY)xxD motif
VTTTARTASATASSGEVTTSPDADTALDGDVNTTVNEALNATILVDSRGRTLYVFSLDAANTPTCYDDATFHCSTAWPPLLADGAARAGKGVDTALLGTVERTDGTVQLTYNKLPLYTFDGYDLGNAPTAAPDAKPGDVNGQGYISSWWVLSPAGQPIKTQP